MENKIYQMIAKDIFAAKIPVQGKAQVRQKPLLTAGNDLLKRFQADGLNMQCLLINDIRAIVKLPRSIQRIGINRENSQNKQQKTATPPAFGR